MINFRRQNVSSTSDNAVGLGWTLKYADKAIQWWVSPLIAVNWGRFMRLLSNQNQYRELEHITVCAKCTSKTVIVYITSDLINIEKMEGTKPLDSSNAMLKLKIKLHRFRFPHFLLHNLIASQEQQPQSRHFHSARVCWCFWCLFDYRWYQIACSQWKTSRLPKSQIEENELRKK